eukprot:TRINITY_DN1446_c5_g1_i1.p1 TRINITY_DN1446_c5_g1~~TRINITY_DN1446_c5_g1_i1.p1  ORF type:complete len:572 (+),score=118.17 TRINITY_DN1446_c5_g1_i1:72-1718(+)
MKLAALTSVLLVHSAVSSPSLPHIVFFLIDDYGWNDVGYHQNKVSSANPTGRVTTNGYIKTPNIDELCEQSVKLENYYVQPLCSPTRGTILTGRYPCHTGIGPNVINVQKPYGMPADEVFLPQLLKEAGYATHMIGKWHLGLCDARYTPTYRGFETYTGYLLGDEDYFNHTHVDHNTPYLDLRQGHEENILPPPLTNKTGIYSAHLFTSAAQSLITSHQQNNPDKPFFLYLPFQSVHAPDQAPESYIEPYNNIIPHDTIHGQTRLVKAGMISAMDEAIGNITKTLKTEGMFDNTVIIFSTDNGGPIDDDNNYPLRGHKMTNWEGGVRGTAFIKGTETNLAPLPKNTTSMELMHSTDWLPTFVEGLAKGSTSSCKPLDGFNQWDVFSGSKTNRTSVVHNVPPKCAGFNGGAVRVGEYKLLIQGMQSDPNTPQTPPPEMAPSPNDTIPSAVMYNNTQVWVFNVIEDPTESINLAATNKTLFNELLDFYLAVQETAVRDLAAIFPDNDPASDPQRRPDHAWGPFINSTECTYGTYAEIVSPVVDTCGNKTT